MYYTKVLNIECAGFNMKIHLLLTLILLSNTVYSQELVKVIAIEYPPLLDSQSKTLGSNFVLFKKYADTHFKVGYEPYFVPPRRAQLLIEQGDWCVSFYPPSKEDKKAKFVSFSQEPMKLGLYRLSQSNAFDYTSLSELHGSVAILRSIASGPVSKKLEAAGLTLVYVEKIEQGIHMLLAERVDYAFGDNTTIDTYINIDNINKIQFSEMSLYDAKVGFFYNKDCEHLLYKTKP